MLSSSLWQSPDLGRLLPDLDHDQIWIEDTPGNEFLGFYDVLCLYTVVLH